MSLITYVQNDVNFRQIDVCFCINMMTMVKISAEYTQNNLSE